MASYTKRGKTWQYSISHKPKPIRKGGFKTKKEAQIAAAEMEYELQRGFTPRLKSEPFDEYFEAWIRIYKKGVGKNTQARYGNSLKTVKNHFAGVPIQNITKRTYQEFINQYAETKAKSSTRKLNTHIRACVRDAIDEGIIRVDFTRGVIFSGKVPGKRPEEKHLNYFDSKRLLKELYNSLNAASYYLILLGLTSGMRYAELMGLTRKDFNFKANEITINKTWGYNKQMHTGFGPTKNEQSNRVLKMDPKTMGVFKAWFAVCTDNIHGLVFYSPSSKYKVLSNNAANKMLKELLERLNIDPISMHGLRHTHASVLLYKKVSIYYVSERLGHSDIETTNQYYAHILKELRELDEKSTVEIFETMIV